ncbi:MAG TPA: lanthionine synthetase LanC family protein [Thermoanaerobaculia bacterium]|nr:lanthionine synthetase LanC family protein [Thermoanaerobaculia bacterium]
MTDALTRRGFLRLALAVGATLPLGTGESGADLPQSAEPPTPSWLDAALQAARWLRTTRVGTPQGLLWLNGPERPEGLISTPDLYSGTSGIVLFLLELARATGDKAWREEAAAGADYLIATLPERLDLRMSSPGLYTGLAGIGFTLHRVYKETGDEKYRKAAVRCRDLIHAAAQPAGAGVQWGEITDIIGGAAGTGLYLLNVAREMDDASSRDLAVRAGLRLAELGIPEAGGLKWRMNPEFKRLMPNFSHGTAGNAYFLATLHRETGRKEFLDAALAGARYLRSIANTQGDGCLIFHNEPEGKDLYYLGWCHGPVGTARLWVRLHQIDGEAGWLEWARKGAKSILASGVPEEKRPGFWNNAGQCCGSAGVAAFFLDLAKLTGDESYRAHARRVARHLVAHGTATPGDGLKWVDAEHRLQADYTYAQTGYMQGAAGIGMLLLQMDATEKNREWTFRLPDSPF